jgi:ParB-like chromosome segregation protein Spo0J
MARLTGSSPRYHLLAVDRLTPHEEVDLDDVKQLVQRIREDGEVREPVLVDRSTEVILDGHHRFHALQRLGCRLIPCFLVDYLEPTIVVERWGTRELMGKHELLQQALAGERYPIKTSQHRTLFPLPERPTSIAELRRDAS